MNAKVKTVGGDDWLGKGPHVHLVDLKNVEVYLYGGGKNKILITKGPGNKNPVPDKAKEVIIDEINDPNWRDIMIAKAQSSINNAGNSGYKVPKIKEIEDFMDILKNSNQGIEVLTK